MAAQSDIPNHPLVQALDGDGEAFRTGSPYHLKNLCSNYQQALAWQTEGQIATTGVPRDDPNCIWWVYYDNNDRSRVSFQNAPTGKWLAAMKPDCKAPMYLAEQQTWWYVYQGSATGYYWLATSQTQDSFLHTWHNSPDWGATIGMFTNRDSNPTWQEFYNMPYSGFEQWGSGMSWALEPAPQLKKWKAEQRAQQTQQAQQPHQAQQAQQGTCCNNCGQNCADVQKAANQAKASNAQADQALKAREDAVAEREKHAQQVEADLKQRDGGIGQREKDLQTKDEGAQKREKDLEAKEEELKKREEAAQASEERVRKTKKGGKADHLATQEENDKMKEDAQKLQAELDDAKKQVEELRNEVKEAQKKQQQQQQQNQPQKSVGGPRQSSSMGGRYAPTIRLPERKNPDRKIPSQKNPDRKVPHSERPGKGLPAGYGGSFTKKFDFGEKLAITAS